MGERFLAGALGSSRGQGGGVPGWQSGDAPFLEMDTENSIYSLNGVTQNSFNAWWDAVGGTYTRTGSKRYIDELGVMRSAAANVWPDEYDPTDGVLRGKSVWPTITARGTWGRDLTNPAWTKTNGTAALDQAGIDAAANSASSFTATAANATCLQSITDATSRNRCLPVFLKGITVTGAVELTVDGGTTWTDIRSRLVSGKWSDCLVSKAGVTNPSWGIRLANSGDKIAWDYGRCVDGYIPGPPLLLTATAETVGDDNAAIPVAGLSSYNASEGVLAIRWMDGANDTAHASSVVSLFTDNNNVLGQITRASNGGLGGEAFVGGVSQGAPGPAIGVLTSPGSYESREKIWAGFSYAVNSFIYSTSGYVGSPVTTFALATATQLRIANGRNGKGGGYVSGLRLYRKGLTGAQFCAATCTPKPVVSRGDSLAQGANASSYKKEWGTIVADGLSPRRTRGDLGVGGSTSAQCLAAIQADTNRRSHTHQVWTGTNDGGLAPETTIATLQAIDALFPHGRVLFGTVLIGPTDSTNVSGKHTPSGSDNGHQAMASGI